MLLNACARVCTSVSATGDAVETGLPPRMKSAVAVSPPGGVGVTPGAVTLQVAVAVAPGSSAANVVAPVGLTSQALLASIPSSRLKNVIACFESVADAGRGVWKKADGGGWS